MVSIVVGPTEQRALEILGPDNVLLASEITSEWGLPFAERPVVPFSEKTLHVHAKDHLGVTWKLVYLAGILKNVTPGYRLFGLLCSPTQRLGRGYVYPTEQEIREALVSLLLVQRPFVLPGRLTLPDAKREFLARRPDLP